VTVVEINSLREYLEFMVESRKKLKVVHWPQDWHYSCMEDLVLREGCTFEYGRTEISGPIKQCFSNAYSWVLAHPDSTYCEGYAQSEDIPIPIHHAWVLDGEGELAETTLRRSEDAAVSYDYFGIAFETDFVIEVVEESGYCGILDDWRRDFKLYREPLPAWAKAGVSRHGRESRSS
jgi:hypothetical protein